MDFIEASDMFICERREEALRKLRNSNEDYIANNKRLIELADKVAACIEHMDAESKGILEAYHDCRSAQESDNMDQAYQCGMKDAFQIMEALAAV